MIDKRQAIKTPTLLQTDTGLVFVTSKQHVNAKPPKYARCSGCGLIVDTSDKSQYRRENKKRRNRLYCVPCSQRRENN